MVVCDSKDLDIVYNLIWCVIAARLSAQHDSQYFQLSSDVILHDDITNTVGITSD
jgi:hypothetical protein